MSPWLANIATRLVTREGWGNSLAVAELQARLAVLPGSLAAAAPGDCRGLSSFFFLLFPQSFDPNLGVVRKMVESSLSAAAANPWVILTVCDVAHVDYLSANQQGLAIPLIGPDATGRIGGIGYIILALLLFFSHRAFAGERQSQNE